jgi:hypothetical protein
MRLLVVGAGASYAECKARGLPEDRCLPMMKNLARKLWADFNPTPFLEIFLEEQGHDVRGRDPVELFYKLEEAKPGLIEEFFASAWQQRDRVHTVYGRRWDDLIYHGLLRPLNFILITGLLDGNPESRFPLSEKVAAQLMTGDLVLNLNYDLIFDVALKNVGRNVVYSPHARPNDGIWAFKPHGSFHLAVNEKEARFYFGQVEFIGDIQPSDGATTFSAFVPPRKAKSLDQHPVSRMIIRPLLGFAPDVVTFWGVGSPESDVDLLDMFRGLCAGARSVEFVNPSASDAKKMERHLTRSVAHYQDVPTWLSTPHH